jgi:hypothetical protein
MLVLIDESGCTGFKLDRGSSASFIVAMVIFDTFGEAERASAAVAAARADLRVKPEFKFSKVSDTVRDGFFCAMADLHFTVRALCVDKSKIYSRRLRTNDDYFYNYVVRMLLRHDGDTLARATVKIDGSGDREFRNALAGYLRRQMTDNKIAKVRFADSRRDNLIQLADMCTGAIARSYRTDRKDARRWRAMLAPKIADIWDFG